MKFQLLSDLHLEFAYWEPTHLADTLILAGDISVGNMVIDYLNDCADTWENVIFVFGNHEFYHNDMAVLRENVKNSVKSNVHVLDNGVVTIEGVNFVGSTLWSDMHSEAFWGLNDSRLISYKKKSITLEKIHALFEENVQFLKDNVVPGMKNVVVTHHAPTFEMSNYQKYGISNITTGFACNILDQFNSKDIAMWVSGHTHACLNVWDNDILNVSNCKGYPMTSGYEDYNFNPNLVLEVEVL